MSLDDHSVLPTEQINEALAGLDLSLESELALYRRSRSAAIELADPAIAFPPADSPGAMTGMEPSTPELVSAEVQSDDEPLDLKIEGDAKLETDLERESAFHQAENTRAGDLIGKSQPLDATFSSVRTARADAGGLMPFTPMEVEDPEALPAPYGDEITAQPKAFERFLDPSIKDYLESSEALLKHLDEPSDVVVPPKKSQKPSKPSWIFPLKVVLGVLGVSALVWLSLFLLSQLFKPKPNPNIQPQPLPSQPLPSQNSAVPSSQGAPPTAPTLPSSASSGLPTVPSSSSSVGSPSPQFALKPPVTPTSTTTPASVPSPTPSLDANAAYYLVVATENGPDALGQAQRVVKDAFAIDIDGQTQIQLGMVDTLPQAQTLVNDFKNQGLAASILPQKN